MIVRSPTGCKMNNQNRGAVRAMDRSEVSEMHPLSDTQDPIRLPVHFIRWIGQNLLSARLTPPKLYDGEQSIAQRSDGTQETKGDGD